MVRAQSQPLLASIPGKLSAPIGTPGFRPRHCENDVIRGSKIRGLVFEQHRWRGVAPAFAK